MPIQFSKAQKHEVYTVIQAKDDGHTVTLFVDSKPVDSYFAYTMEVAIAMSQAMLKAYS